MKDPVKDAMQMVYVDGYRAGLERGRLQSTLGALLRGVMLGVVLALLLVGYAVAQVPDKANEYRRDLTRLSRSVWGMDAPVSNLAAQIHQESGWNPSARSRAGALGLAQFMPSTAAGIARDFADFPQPLDPRWSMLYQSRYMKQLYDETRHATDACERYAFALAAYNGGMGWVRRRQQMSDTPAVCLFAACEINPGILPSNQKENAEYPRRILLRLTPLYYEAQWGPARCVP